MPKDDDRVPGNDMDFEKRVEFKSKDSNEQIATGIVLEPYSVDQQGDWLRPEGIESLYSPTADHGVMHSVFPEGHSETVRNEIIDEPEKIGDEEFPPGTWVISRKYSDPDLWNLIEDGILGGFSMGGSISESREHPVNDLPDEVEVTADYQGETTQEILNGVVKEISDVDIPAVPRAEYQQLKAKIEKNLLEDVDGKEEFIGLMGERGHSRDEAGKLWDYLTKVEDEFDKQLVIKQEWSVRVPQDGTHYDEVQAGGPDWSVPPLEDFDGDMREYSNIFLYSETGFPAENAGDLSFPIITPEGTLRLEALDSAWRMAGQADIPTSAQEEIREAVRTLVNRHWDDSDLQRQVEEYFEDRENNTPKSIIRDSDPTNNETMSEDSKDKSIRQKFVDWLLKADDDEVNADTIKEKVGRTLSERNLEALMSAHDSIERTLSNELEFDGNQFTEIPDFEFDVADYKMDQDDLDELKQKDDGDEDLDLDKFTSDEIEEIMGIVGGIWGADRRQTLVEGLQGALEEDVDTATLRGVVDNVFDAGIEATRDALEEEEENVDDSEEDVDEDKEEEAETDKFAEVKEKVDEQEERFDEIQEKIDQMEQAIEKLVKASAGTHQIGGESSEADKAKEKLFTR